MAHCRAYQISTKPIDPDEHITEDDFPEYLIGYVFDGVICLPDEYREDELERLSEKFGPFGVVNTDEETILFNNSQKESYFKPKYEALVKAAEALSKISYEVFVGGKSPLEPCREMIDGRAPDIDQMVLKIKDICDGEVGDYIFDSEEQVVYPVDQWLRWKMDPSHQYWIGGILDLHY